MDITNVAAKVADKVAFARTLSEIKCDESARAIWRERQFSKIVGHCHISVLLTSLVNPATTKPIAKVVHVAWPREKTEVRYFSMEIRAISFKAKKAYLGKTITVHLRHQKIASVHLFSVAKVLRDGGFANTTKAPNLVRVFRP